MSRRWGGALSSGLLLLFSYPPFDQGWLAWVALVPWLAALRSAGPRAGFALGTLAGLVFFGGSLWWMAHVTVAGTLLLVAYLALFFGAWGLFAQWVIGRDRASGGSLGSPIILAAGWALLEYLRAVLLTGFGWNLLAHTQWEWIPLIQVADLAGAYGVSFVVVLVNGFLHRALQVRTASGRAGSLLLAAAAIAGCLAYGWFRLAPTPLPVTHRVSPARSVALLQGNIPQTLKWEESFREEIWQRYEALTLEAAGERPDLIVWPETAVPGFLGDPSVGERLDRVSRSARIPLLVGVPTEERGTGRLFNSALLLDAEGNRVERYDKLHLVPFGEYVPLKPLLGWLNNVVPIGDFSRGRRFTIFRLKTVPGTGTVPGTEGFSVPPFSVLICFEDLFPGLSRRFVREGARTLFVLTNDAWFGHSAASLQHLQASVFRAVECRVPVGRAANSGWTGWVDPFGRRLPPPAQAERFETATALAPWSPGPGRSPYLRWGDWFVGVCLLGVGWAFLPSRRRL